MKVKSFLGILSIAFLGAGIALGLNSIINKNDKEAIYLPQKENVVHFTKSTNTAEGNLDFSDAAAKTVDAVVHVKTIITGNGNSQPTIYDFFFGNPYNQGTLSPMQASGSGVIISDDGYIVTNNHVIDKANEIEIILNDKRSFKARLIGADPSTDIALLKIEAENLTVITYGDSENIKVGEWVLAIGNPFNLTSTVTAGIVSAKARNLNIINDRVYAIESFIQTDAAVNPGNSGGALVNTKGELVGINTAIASRTGSYSGYSFAVPVTIVKKTVADLKEFGTVQRALLGVSIRDIDSELAEELGINDLSGVYVAEANEGSAAKDAGIKKDDIIIKVNNIKVNKVSELQEQISKYRPGDKITIAVKRVGKIKNIAVVLKNSMGTTGYVNKEASEILGCVFSDVSEKEKEKLGITHGIKVTDLQAGKLLKAGVQKGFIIVYMNREAVNSFDDVQKILNKTRGGVYIEGIYPDGTTGYYAFGLK